MKYPFWGRVKIRIMGSVPAFKTHELDYRYGYCKIHGYYVNYLHAYDRLLSCADRTELRIDRNVVRHYNSFGCRDSLFGYCSGVLC